MSGHADARTGANSVGPAGTAGLVYRDGTRTRSSMARPTVAVADCLLLAVLLVVLVGTLPGLVGATQHQVAGQTGDVGTDGTDDNVPAQTDASGTNETGASTASGGSEIDSNQTKFEGTSQLEGTLAASGTTIQRRYTADVLATQLDGAEIADRRAELVADAQETIAAEADRLTERRSALDRARAAGELDRGAYFARLAPLLERARGVQETAQTLQSVTDRLPADARERHGVNASAVRDSLERATAVVEGDDSGGVETFLGRPGDAPAAQSPSEEVFADLVGVTNQYNRQVASVDFGTLGWQFENARVTITVTSSSGDGRAAFELDGEGRIHGVRPGPHADPTLRLSTDRATFDSVRTADNPARAFQRGVSDGDVTVEGVGPVDRLVWSVVDLLRGVV